MKLSKIYTGARKLIKRTLKKMRKRNFICSRHKTCDKEKRYTTRVHPQRKVYH